VKHSPTLVYQRKTQGNQDFFQRAHLVRRGFGKRNYSIAGTSEPSPESRNNFPIYSTLNKVSEGVKVKAAFSWEKLSILF